MCDDISLLPPLFVACSEKIDYPQLFIKTQEGHKANRVGKEVWDLFFGSKEFKSTLTRVHGDKMLKPESFSIAVRMPIAQVVPFKATLSQIALS